MSTNQEQVKWVIDCDPGCDDAVALALLAWMAPDLEDVEIMTVAGNVGVDLTKWNACRIVAACGKTWPVYRGCGSSLSGESVPAASVHGRDGLGDIPNNAFGISPKDPEQESAVRRYMHLAESEQKFILVCTGPLTNLASALNLMAPERVRSFWQRCEICVIMGGAFESHGNITSSAEFNFHFDPVAVHLVLQSWRIASASNVELRPIHFVSLDTTEQVGIPLHQVAKKIDGTPPSSATPFLRAALRKYGMFHARNCLRPVATDERPAFGIKNLDETEYLKDRLAGKSGITHLGAFCYLHDPLAMWMALQRNESNFTDWWSRARVDIDLAHGPGRGQIIQHDLQKAEKTLNRAEPLGTDVLWLKPNEYDPSVFVESVKTLLNLAEP